MNDLIGKVIDNYRLEGLLGDGGMGTVYRAHDLNLDRPVALKLMHPHYIRQPEFRARLRKEAKSAASLDHPCIVRVYGFGESEEWAYIAMEYLDGGNLRSHLQRVQGRQRFLPVEQALQIGYQIADALDYAHRRGLIHRDVKPSNIILKRLVRPDEAGQQPFRAVLTDFGLVKLLEGDQLTQSGTTMGTPTYMSPEQCEGQNLDGRSDLYSLGVVLYELFTNRLPFSFKTLSEAIALHRRGTMPIPARQTREALSPAIEAILGRALHKQAAGRYHNGAEMAEALRSLQVAVSDSPTRVFTVPERVESQGTPVAPPRPAEIPAGYELTILTPGHEASRVALTRPMINIGRGPDNDIVLPADGVSRNHARFQVADGGWSLVDLGGVNGTWLNERRLRANEVTRLRPADKVQIGPYLLTVSGPEPVANITQAMPHTPIAELPTAPPSPAPSRPDSPLAIFVARDKLNVAPGQQVELVAEISNRGELDDRVTVRVVGLPESWVDVASEFIAVPAGETVQVSLAIHPPRRPDTPAGRQRFRLELRSQTYPQSNPSVGVSLMLATYESFEAALNPQRVHLPGKVRVSLVNNGNSPTEFSVVGRDNQQQIQFQGERGRIRLDPRQTANLELDLEPRRQSWFSANDAYPFEIEVRTRSGGRQSLAGEANIPALIPAGLQILAVLVMVVTCFVAVIFLVFGNLLRPGSFNATAATATAQAATAQAETVLQTVVAATATIEAATRMAITPTAVTNDPDNDGLSDSQEIVLGTSPTDADSDDDGLTDGDEALKYGCNPLKRDTDEDVLPDWDEVNRYQTNCNNRDSDGDGVADGTEVTNGTDPKATPLASPSPLPAGTTPPPPTPLPTNTATATGQPTLTPSLTPSATATGLPTPTPTTTPLPASATPTVTTSPTATPTITSTPTQSPSPTTTPNPLLACITTPPTIDGQLADVAWSLGPTFTFVSAGDPAHTTVVYLTRDATNLYLAFRLNDNVVDLTDAIRVYFDVNRNSGDPDVADRFFEIKRDLTFAVQRGLGNNSDGNNWDATYVSPNWTTAIGNPGPNQWLVELQIEINNELSGLANPFGLMLQADFGNEIVPWPPTANPLAAATWPNITNNTCP